MMHAGQEEQRRAVLAALCRTNFYAFLWKAFDTLHPGPGEPFIPNWHVEAICHALEEVRRGKTMRLVITMPPRHLKSIATAVAFPAFLLGHDPSCKIIVASYALDLARKHAEDFRRIIESDWYRAYFPAVRIARRGARQDEIITTAGGSRKAVSIGGAVTGFGADYLIVDDLLKAADAGSEAERERAKAYLDGSLLSRLNDPNNGRVIAIQQRLHEDDPAGYLLSKGTYRHLNLPAIAETDVAIPLGNGLMHQRLRGEALFPQRLDLPALEQLRKEMGSATFNMQYQQDPLAPDGSPLRWEWFQVYDDPRPRNYYQLVVQSWDTGMSADPNSDFSVCTTWGFREGNWYLLDVYRDRLDYPDLKKRVLQMGEDWNADVVLIEKAGTGIPLLQECFRLCRHRFREVKPLQDKQIRFNAACAPVEAGKIFLPREAPWLPDFRRELQSFPRGRYDDQVDSFSQFINWSTTPMFWRALPRDDPSLVARRRETEARREQARHRERRRR